MNEDKLELVPASRLTDSQRTAIKQHKSELLSLLAANESYSPLEEVNPHTQDELNRLLNQAARPLYHHLIDCQQCSLEDARYCSDGMTLVVVLMIVIVFLIRCRQKIQANESGY